MSGNTLPVKKSKRLLNVELLRILSMFFIVCNHFLGHGLKLQDYDFEDPNRLFLWFFRGLCYTGTNLFVIISAYFQCKSQFRLKGLLLLICKVLFYSIVVYVLLVACGLTEFSSISLVKMFTPILSTNYWFITSYIVLCLIAPFINKFISILTKYQYRSLLLILFVCLSLIPNILYNSIWINFGGSCGIVWFVYLYLVAGYIRLHVDVCNISSKRLIWTLAIFMLLPLVSKIMIAYLTHRFAGNVVGSSIFYNNNSILIFPLSVLIFISFLKIDLSGKWTQRIITFFASSIFAVYLISEHPSLSGHIWSYCSQIAENNNSIIPLLVILIPIIILAICILLDQFRVLIFMFLGKTGIPQKIEGFVSKYTGKLYSDL